MIFLRAFHWWSSSLFRTEERNRFLDAVGLFLCVGVKPCSTERSARRHFDFRLCRGLGCWESLYTWVSFSYVLPGVFHVMLSLLQPDAWHLLCTVTLNAF